MDGTKFDQLTKGFGRNLSRRQMVRGLVSGAGLAFLAGKGTAFAQRGPAAKIDICHYDADLDTYQWLNINGNAWPAHAGHGDFLRGASDGCCLNDECTAHPNSYCNKAATGGAVCACAPTPKAVACDGQCGEVSDGCGGKHDCGPCGCPAGTVAVGEQCLLVNGSTCIPAPSSTECASSRCNVSGICIGCTNSMQCVGAFGTGYTCTGDTANPGICQAPA
jgi:hypothetical protein